VVDQLDGSTSDLLIRALDEVAEAARALERATLATER
jgi:hypothetical protein